MTKTHTPLIIEGKIYVVVDAPAKPNLIYRVDYEHYNELLAACTKYETLPEHAPYWEERIGKRVEVEIEYPHGEKDGRGYAIPPQQKQGDEWEEIYRGVQEKFGTPSGNYFQTYATVGEVIQYIKNSLTKK